MPAGVVMVEENRVAVAGERKMQILQVLASMLEAPVASKITTAALAERLQVSEAALYRHFASKAQMFDGLIEFIEQSVFSLVNRILSSHESGLKQTEAIFQLLLGFAQTNPGMTRVLIGEALVHENERLQARINQFHDRLEASLRQSLRIAVTQGETAVDPALGAAMLLSAVTGQWQMFVRSQFRRKLADDSVGLWLVLQDGLRTRSVT